MGQEQQATTPGKPIRSGQTKGASNSRKGKTGRHVQKAKRAPGTRRRVYCSFGATNCRVEGLEACLRRVHVLPGGSSWKPPGLGMMAATGGGRGGEGGAPATGAPTARLSLAAGVCSIVATADGAWSACTIGTAGASHERAMRDPNQRTAAVVCFS